MRKLTTHLAIFTLLSAGASFAGTCETAAAEEKLIQASEAEVILSVGVFNNIPTIAVEPEVWALLDVNTRLGMIETFECVMAGPGNILAKVQVISGTGKVMATYDGIQRELAVIE